MCRNRYIENLEISKENYFISLIIDELAKKSGNNIRIHPSGDFYSVDYINKWIEICKQLSNYNFWCYTRSWIVPELLSSLRKLNKIKNIQIFLSTDPSMDLPPDDFRIAFIEDDKRSSGIICLHDSGLKKSCDKCGYCFKNKKGNVIFKNKRRKRK